MSRLLSSVVFVTSVCYVDRYRCPLTLPVLFLDGWSFDVSVRFIDSSKKATNLGSKVLGEERAREKVNPLQFCYVTLCYCILYYFVSI